jgi:hypothetical protein
MTTFTTNTADLNARGRRLLKAQEAADTQVWRLTDLIPMALARFVAPDPLREIDRAARREAARRSVDNLMR